jgi:hypothetical protein
VKDEEIDDVLKGSARDAHVLRAETLERISGSIKTSLRPVRPLPPAWLLASGLVLICAAVALGGAAHAGFFGIGKMDLMERALIFSTLAVFAWVVGIGFVHEMVPGSRRRVSPGALLGIVIGLLVGVFALLFRDYQISDFFSVGIACLLTGFLFAVPTGLLAWLLLRRGFAVNPVSAGLVAGTLAGLAGVAMLELHCPNFQAAHVLVWHIAVLPVSAAAGALVGWALRLRASSGDR